VPPEMPDTEKETLAEQPTSEEVESTEVDSTDAQPTESESTAAEPESVETSVEQSADVSAVPASEPASAPRSPAADWDRVAEELGLVMPEAPGDAESPAVEQEVASDALLEGQAEGPDEPVESGPSSSGQKRRKRRRRPRKMAAESFEASDTETVDSLEDGAEPVVDVPAGEGKKDSPDKPSSATVEGGKGRSKRRRRRRPGRKKNHAEGDSTAEQSAEEAAAPREAAKVGDSGLSAEDERESLDAEAAETKPAADDAAKKKQSPTAASVKPSHRGIPTWDDAMDLIISANMQVRSKGSGNSSSSRSRGGRGRGGRDKAAKKGTG